MPAAGTVKDKATGRFVKVAPKKENPEKDERDLEIERLKAELEIAKGPEKDTTELEAMSNTGTVTEPLREEDLLEDKSEDLLKGKPAREPLRLQSKFTGHTISFKPTIRRVYADLGIVEPVPGIFVQFLGPQRLFDSHVARDTWDWSDEILDMVERKLVEKKEYMIDYFPAPASKIPDHLKEYVRVKSPDKPRACSAFGYLDGKLIQCKALATAGRDWCHEHDPNVTRIKQGGGTTVG